jgi:tripartite-type tricarboxylate transporter receptor subunit TctC
VGLLRRAASAAILTLSTITAAQADPVADFYAGKQITAVVGNPPGGDYDNWVRLITRHWGDHIPGHPTFVVQNMPGAGQIIATNWLYNSAARDGSVVGMTERALPYLRLLGDANIRFDSAKFNWLGSPESTNRACVAMQNAPVRRAEDLFHQQLLVGGAGAGTSVSNAPVLLSKLLGMKFKLVEGYGSAENIVLAMERGELQGICQTLAGLDSIRHGWVAQGKFRVLFTMERAPVPGVDAPTIFQFAKTQEQADALELFDSSIELGRPMIAPPGVPADRVAALRESFAQTMIDPAFLADAARLHDKITLTRGEDLQAMIAHLEATPKKTIDLLKSLTP